MKKIYAPRWIDRAGVVCSAMLVAALGSVASAQVANLGVDNTQSDVSAEICIAPPGLSTECDTDSSSLSGSLSVELDDYVNPGAITMDDFTLVVDHPMTYSMDWGFFVGSLDIQISDVVVHYATPGIPTGPVAVDGNGNFDFPVLSATFTGTGAYQGHGPIIGSLVGSGSFNLADFGASDAAIAGTVSIANGIVTISGAQTFANTGDVNGVTTTISGTATLLATGDVPNTCRVDLNNDGIVNTQDFLAYLNLFTASDPQADFNGDGIVNTLDFVVFLNEWTTGC